MENTTNKDKEFDIANENFIIVDEDFAEYPPISADTCRELGFLHAAEAAELSHDLTPSILDIDKRIREAAHAGLSSIAWYAPILSNVPRAALASICYTLHLMGYKTEYVYTMENKDPVGIKVYW